MTFFFSPLALRFALDGTIRCLVELSPKEILDFKFYKFIPLIDFFYFIFTMHLFRLF